MSFTYDPSTPLGLVRVYIGDAEEARAVFSDAELEDFLRLAEGSAYGAAAFALMRVAESPVIASRFVAVGNPLYWKPLQESVRQQARLCLGLVGMER